MDNIKKIIINDGEVFDELLTDPLIMWVDWGEFDEDIIHYCEDILKTGELDAESIDTDSDRGFDIVITYKGEQTIIPYEHDYSDRDTTIITLNKVIAPKYELRLCEWSRGSDTLGFTPMLASDWIKLGKEFGIDKVQKQFSVIDDNIKMFGGE